MSVLYVLDVDGTVADPTHRKHHLEQPEADWAAFFEPSALLADTPIEAARDHFEDGRFRHGECVYLTARIESVHDVSKRWLVQHGFAREDTRVLCKPETCCDCNARPSSNRRSCGRSRATIIPAGTS